MQQGANNATIPAKNEAVSETPNKKLLGILFGNDYVNCKINLRIIWIVSFNCYEPLI